MENKEELQLTLEGLNCAHCAAKIEEKVGKLEGVKSVVINLILVRKLVWLFPIKFIDNA